MITLSGNRFDDMVRRWSVPVAVRLSRFRVVTADRVSFFGFIMGGVAAAGLVLADRWILAAGAFVVADFADYIDGDVARAQGTASDRGDILDGVLDRYVDFLILLALTLQALDVVGGSSRSMAGFGHPPSWTIAVTGALAIFERSCRRTSERSRRPTDGRPRSRSEDAALGTGSSSWPSSWHNRPGVSSSSRSLPTRRRCIASP
ncbi:MAG: CDP-alcohol phosphatidyltransferase family protein [Candidatus Microthrix sp.]|nr:CDP-alcohol phosphatidyltransferase family protein [Candidatus Microthrix sp.]MBK7324431.1 CDP-alcohol phosphatidyltransferase family protein [Candidatus Microthrix sp.]